MLDLDRVKLKGNMWPAEIENCWKEAETVQRRAPVRVGPSTRLLHYWEVVNQVSLMVSKKNGMFEMDNNERVPE